MKTNDILNGVDIANIVKQSVREEKTKLLGEAFVAEPKQYKQVSEAISQDTKDNHVKLYKGYVDSFNRVSAELDSADRENVDSRHNDYRSLKLDETYNVNAVWLHELYFANAFDPHSELFMDTQSYMKLEKQWGTFDAWQQDFVACALSCGQGWAVCGLSLYLKSYVNTIVSNHSQDVMIGLVPLIVLDVHEHARYADYGADTKNYVVSSMRTLDWGVIEERFEKAEKILQAIK